LDIPPMEPTPLRWPPWPFDGRRLADRLAGLSVVFAILVPILVLAAVAACGGGDPEAVARRGRSLEIHLEPLDITQRLSFVDTSGQRFVIRPRATNRRLAAANVTIVNRTSTVIPLLIDTDSVQLGDRRGERIGALDPLAAARVDDSPNAVEFVYTPFLWGEIELERHFQISGWVVFDVPKGLRLSSLWWNEVDKMILDLVE